MKNNIYRYILFISVILLGLQAGKVNAQAFFDNTFDALNNLPVKFLSFSGVKQNGDVALAWVTATETNNSHFNVEKSFNGVDYQFVGKVAGKGNTVTETRYAFTDNKVPNQTIFYRLRQFDFDGVANLSTVVVIKSDGSRVSLIGVYPNPVKGNIITLSFENMPIGKYYISLLGINGSRMHQQTFEHKVPSEVIQLFLQSQPAKGVYILNTTYGKEQRSQKIVIE